MTYKHLNKLRLQINKTFRCVRNLLIITFATIYVYFVDFFWVYNFFRMDPLLLPWAKPLQHVSTLVRQFLFDLIFIAENVVLLSIALNSHIIELRVSQSPKLKTEYRNKTQYRKPGFMDRVKQFWRYQYLCSSIIFLFSDLLI